MLHLNVSPASKVVELKTEMFTIWYLALLKENRLQMAGREHHLQMCCLIDQKTVHNTV